MPITIPEALNLADIMTGDIFVRLNKAEIKLTDENLLAIEAILAIMAAMHGQAMPIPPFWPAVRHGLILSQAKSDLASNLTAEILATYRNHGVRIGFDDDICSIEALLAILLTAAAESRPPVMTWALLRADISRIWHGMRMAVAA